MNINIGTSLPIERTEDDDLFGRSGDSNTRLVIIRSHDLDTGRTSTRIGLATRRSCRASDDRNSLKDKNESLHTGVIYREVKCMLKVFIFLFCIHLC